LRSSIVKATCDVILSSATLLQEDFQTFNNDLVKPLLKGTFSIIESIASSCRMCIEEIVQIQGTIGTESYVIFEEYIEDLVFQGSVETKVVALKIVSALHKAFPETFNIDKIQKSLKKLKKEDDPQIKQALSDLEQVLSRKNFDQEMVPIPILEVSDVNKSISSTHSDLNSSIVDLKPLLFSPIELTVTSVRVASRRSSIVESMYEKKDGSTSPREKFLYTPEDLEKAKQEGMQQVLQEMAIVTADYDELEHRMNQEVRKRRELEGFIQNYEREFKNLSLKNGDEKEKDGIKTQYTQLLIDYSKIESSFKELKSRYDDIKIVNEKFKQNESLLKEKAQTFQKEAKIIETKYNKLKDHAEEQLNNANQKLKELATAKAQLEHKVSLLEKDISAQKVELEEKDAEIDTLNEKLKKSASTPKNQIKALEDKIKMLEEANEKQAFDLKEADAKIHISEEELRKQKEDGDAMSLRSEELQQSLHVFYEENQKLKAKIYDKTNEIEALKSLISSSATGSSNGSTFDLEEKLRKEEEKRLAVETRLKAKEKENKELLDICNQLLSKIERKPEE